MRLRAVLTDVRPAGEVIPGYAPNLILTSGAPLPFAEYTGGQREAIIGAAQFEGLAPTREDAIAELESGEIVVDGAHGYGCVGSLAGVYTASMPVFVVENPPFGNTAFCNFYEGKERRRLNYGCYDAGVHERLEHINNVLGPVVGKAVRAAGGIELVPIMRRAVQMGDECHSRSAAATMLFEEALALPLLDLAADDPAGVRALYEAFQGNDYHFLRLSMAACKAACDAAHGIEGSTVVTAMTFSCQGFAIRVSGLGDTWFRGPHADGHGEALPGPHRGRDHVDGRRVDHHRDGRAGRLRAGRGAAAAALPGRHGAGAHRPQPRAVRHRRRRAHGVQDPAVRLPRHAHRHRRREGDGDGHPARDGRRHPGPRRRPDRRRLHPRADRVLPQAVAALDADEPGSVAASRSSPARRRASARRSRSGLAADGAMVACVDVNGAGAAETAAQIGAAGGRAVGVSAT